MRPLPPERVELPLGYVVELWLAEDEQGATLRWALMHAWQAPGEYGEDEVAGGYIVLPGPGAYRHARRVAVEMARAAMRELMAQ